jgi:cytochrome P450
MRATATRVPGGQTARSLVEAVVRTQTGRKEVMRMGETLGEIDLVDPDNYVRAVPYGWFDHLRHDHPIVWHPEPPPNHGFWAVTRYDDLTAIHMDWPTFSSELGAVALEELDEGQLEIRRSMLETDPPRHTELRRICTKQFSARGVGRYEDWIRDVASGVLDRALSEEAFDFVAEISRELPIRFLCSIFTVPQDDAPQLIRWGDQMIANQDPELSAAVVDRVDTEAYRNLPFRSPTAYDVFAYADRQRDLRLQEPSDDVIQALVTAQSEGILDEREYHNYFALLMIAGNETTRHTISAGMLALAQHPDQLELLRDEPERIGVATEEILRWATPVHHFRRTVTHDVEFDGVQMRRGDKVVTWYTSANRDETRFPDPYRFDVTRTPNEHVTFGPGGPHFCLGAHLARLETKILFQELIPRLRSIEIVGPVERIRSNFVNGIKRMPVRVRIA